MLAEHSAAALMESLILSKHPDAIYRVAPGMYWSLRRGSDVRQRMVLDLAELGRNGDATIRCLVAEGLEVVARRGAASQAEQVLLTLTSDREPSVRVAALASLGALGAMD